jgi:hypothetical protein
MNSPNLKILGAYRPVISKETWHDQWGVTGDDDQTKEHFDHLVLIEALVEGLSEPFDMSKFGQMQPEHPDDSRYMQVGYDEALLSADGETLVQRDMNCVRGSGQLRFAVYLHYYHPDQPLLWQAGAVNCPPIQDAPLRLMMLVPYNACT